MSSLTSYFRVFLLILIFLTYYGVSSLKNVRILAAEAVRSGDSMYLVCEYDLENIPLYSIKWYFNLYEFYSFIPKEIPPKRVFLVPGITVDISESDNKSVTLRSVQRQLTGYYECEVSADAPLFDTDIKKMLIIVTEKPETSPFINVEKTKYSEGDIIKANCTSYKGYPAANLTWFINNQEITNKNVKIVKYFTQIIVSDTAERLETSRSTLELLTTSNLFSKGKLTLSCEATQFNLYRKRTEINLLEDAPQLAHVLSPARSSSHSSKINNKIIQYLTACFILSFCYLRRR